MNCEVCCLRKIIKKSNYGLLNFLLCMQNVKLHPIVMYMYIVKHTLHRSNFLNWNALKRIIKAFQIKYLVSTTSEEEEMHGIPGRVKPITKTRLFKYIENFTTKKMKIFR